MGTNLYFTALIAFFVTILIIVGLTPIAHKVDLVDHPNTFRKHHRGKIPLIGGIAIAIGFCIGILALDISLSTFRALLAAYLLLTIIGIMDDFNELSPRLRMIAQLIVGLLVTCWGGILLNNLGNIFGSSWTNIGYWGLPLTVIAVIALINANNMLDGLNGLAGSTSFVTLACLYWIALRSHAHNDQRMILVLLSCVLSFLCFNFPVLRYRNRLVFLGDAGSTGLGLMIAWFAIKLSQPPYHFLKPAYLVWLLILPIFDLISVSLRRILIKRVSPLHADREHIHHFFQKIGFRNSIVTFILKLIALAGGLIAIFMAQYQFSQPLAFTAFIVLFLIYFIYANLYWSKKL